MVYVLDIREECTWYDENLTPSAQESAVAEYRLHMEAKGAPVEVIGHKTIFRGELEEILRALQIDWGFWQGEDEPFDLERARGDILQRNPTV